MDELALTGEIAKFWSILSSYSKSKIKITLRKKFSCLSDNFEIFVIFEILAIFEFSKAILTKWPKILAIFFVIFRQVDVFYILVEFEVDGIRPNECTKNGRKSAHGLNCKIFVNFETIYEIYDKNYSSKKNLMSLRRFWFFLLLITWDI